MIQECFEKYNSAFASNHTKHTFQNHARRWVDGGTKVDNVRSFYSYKNRDGTAVGVLSC